MRCLFPPCRQAALLEQVFTSVTLLTFILFWTITNNVVYLF